MTQPTGYVPASESPFTMFGRPTYTPGSNYVPGTLQGTINAKSRARAQQQTRRQNKNQTNPRNNLRQTVAELENTVGEVNEEKYQLQLAAARKELANAKAVSNAATQRRQNMERSLTSEQRAIQAAYGPLGAPGRPGITGAVPGAYSASGQREAANEFGRATIAEQGRGFRGPLISGTASQQGRNLLNNATRRRGTPGTGTNNWPNVTVASRSTPGSSTGANIRPTVPVRPIGSQTGPQTLVVSGIPAGAFRRQVTPPATVNPLPPPINTYNALRAERQAAIQAAANARTRITILEDQIKALTGPNAENRRAALQQQLNAERQRSARAEEALRIGTGALQTATNTITTLEGELAAARRELANAANPAAITQLQNEINRLTTELREARAEQNAAIISLTAERNAALGRETTIQGDLDEARRELEEARAGAADPAEINRLQGEINRLTVELTAAQAAAFGPGSLDPTAAAALTAERNAARAAAAAFGLGSLDPTAAAALTAERNAARAAAAAAAAFGPGSLDPTAAAALQNQLIAVLQAQLDAAQALLGSLDPATVATIQPQLAAIQSQITAAQTAITGGTLTPTTISTIQTALTTAQGLIAAAITAAGPSGPSGGPGGPSGGPGGPSGGPGGPSGPSGKKGPCATGSGWRCQKPTRGGRRRRIRRKRYTRR